MADFNKPATTDTYVNVLAYLKATTSDIALGLDPATTTPTNVPTNAVRWSSVASKWQKYNGTSWADLAATYAISITGNAATATSATSASSATSATTATNLASGSAGAVPYQSAAGTTSMSGVGTTGQALLSGGAGAPTWGTLGIAGGGTGATSAINALVSLGERTSATGSTKLPSGTTSQRDTSASSGFIRFNTDTVQFEGYNGTGWTSVGGGAKGGGSNQVFYENDQTITTNYTITSGKNAMSAGPITINDGITVTVPDGSAWSIV